MAIATAIITLIANLAPIVGKLITGSISEADARKQSGEAIAQFAFNLKASEAGDLKRDAETDAKLDAIDKKFDAGAPDPEKVVNPDDLMSKP